ncbi:hypothetical protein CNE_1c00160 [Cupriavidus necator N-1]|uniref:Vanillate O-demethylase oxygenase-like C-terminal catalytic domain-containing protein n=1 Tax=Cupriavidus necator (strain ATCC 43291 / DSM 13513 / CCUG 52238 / LMG 8453 / N-1) TaxID=1042878 RepID=G0ERV8_CUPNN|nr:hypothetical protein [Cupriavidus necator]AEI75386.1 hypothetical protein CNE_1c00160 [Cupriavidus necator N-1]MDX6012469.1 aromatic ring-hydroxylating dioxygenase subunit alpha [Cupriavidus necator]
MMKPYIDPALAGEWLVAAASASVAPGQTFQACVLGQAIAVTRDMAGGLRAQVRHDDASAQPEEIRVLEQYATIWIAFETPTRPLFAIDEFDQPGRRIIPCGAIGVHTSGLRIVENFLDMAHFPYVHTDWLGKEPHSAVAEYKVEWRQATDELWATDCRFWQPRAAPSADGGLDIVYTYRVMQPFTTMLYKSCPTRPGDVDFILLQVQPQDEEHSLVYSLLGYFDDVSSNAEMISFMQLIFAQDKPILESQVPRRLPLDPRTEVPARADAMSIAYRRWLRDKRLRFGVHA